MTFVLKSRFFPLLAGFSAFLATALLSACKKQEPEGVVLARVNESALTLDEVRESFPAEYEEVLPREHYLDLIQRWIDDEAVYQQALARKVEEEPAVRRKLERLRRRMIIEEFLAREVGGAGEPDPDEAAMTRYYEANKSAFRRKQPEFRYLHLRLRSVDEALAVRKRLQGDNFEALAARHSLDYAIGLASTPFRKPVEIPSCLHAVLNAQPGWVSNPLTCPDGVYILRLQDRIEAGSTLPFPEVRETIRAQLAMQHKDRMRESKIRQYKEGLEITLNLDRIPGQSGGGASWGRDPDSLPDDDPHPGE